MTINHRCVNSLAYTRLQICQIPIMYIYPFRVRLKGVAEGTARYRNGAWAKQAFVVLSDRHLGNENVFECDVAVPGTNYKVRKKTLYTPGKSDTTAAAAAAGKENLGFRSKEVEQLFSPGSEVARF